MIIQAAVITTVAAVTITVILVILAVAILVESAQFVKVPVFAL